MSDWNCENIKQVLSNTPRYNFCCLKVIHILQAKVIGHILENKQMCLNSGDCTINHNENEKWVT